jgi:hypothetical protein
MCAALGLALVPAGQADASTRASTAASCNVSMDFRLDTRTYNAGTAWTTVGGTWTGNSSWSCSGAQVYDSTTDSGTFSGTDSARGVLSCGAGLPLSRSLSGFGYYNVDGEAFAVNYQVTTGPNTATAVVTGNGSSTSSNRSLTIYGTGGASDNYCPETFIGVNAQVALVVTG